VTHFYLILIFMKLHHPGGDVSTPDNVTELLVGISLVFNTLTGMLADSPLVRI